MSLTTSRLSVEKPQNSLQAKAKLEPSYRFYSLWDKVCREEVLRESYRRSRQGELSTCPCRIFLGHRRAVGNSLHVWLCKRARNLTRRASQTPWIIGLQCKQCPTNVEHSRNPHAPEAKGAQSGPLIGVSPASLANFNRLPPRLRKTKT